MAKGKEKKGKGGVGDGSSATDGVPLAGEVLHSSLKDVSRTVDGSGYAYVRLTCVGKGITSLPEKLSHYVHLRYIDISNNKIQDLTPFSKLPHVLTLNASSNSISDISCLNDPTNLPFLALLNLSGNQIANVPPIPLQRLTRLALDANPIAKLDDFQFPPSLTHFSLRGTPLESLDSLVASESLTSLYLSHTTLQDFKRLENFPALKTLDLEGVPLQQEQLQQLLVAPLLRELSLAPFEPEAEESQFRVDVLSVLPRLQWLNGKQVSLHERKSAAAVRKAKKKLLQEQAQEEARRAAEDAELGEEASQ